MGPFIMNHEGVGRLFAPLALLADGPFPEHYEPIESPIANPLHPAAVDQPGGEAVPLRGGQARDASRGLQRRLHHLPAHRALPLLDQEQSDERAAHARALHRDPRRAGATSWASAAASKLKVTSARGHYIAKAMVTRRIKPMMIDGKKTYQIGIPIHWGYRGIPEDDGQDRPHARRTCSRPRSSIPTPTRPSSRASWSRSRRQGAMSQATSAHHRISGPCRSRSRRRALQREPTVAKLVDTTTCIGCKACEVACMEWNDLPFRETVFDNTYQTMPETAWNYWNLIQFHEIEPEDGDMQWLMRKDQCMHCADPGCLDRLPRRRRHRPVQERHRRFPAGLLHRLPVLRHRLPVQHPEVQPGHQEDVQVHAVQRPRRAGAGARLHQGLSHRLPALRHQGRHDRARPGPRRCSSASIRASPRRGLRPGRRRRHRVIYVLHDATNPEAYGGLPRDPRVPWTVRLWKGPLKWLGNLAMVGGLIGVYAPLPALRTQEGRSMSRSERSHERCYCCRTERVVAHFRSSCTAAWFSYLYVLAHRARLLVPAGCTGSRPCSAAADDRPLAASLVAA